MSNFQGQYNHQSLELLVFMFLCYDDKYQFPIYLADKYNYSNFQECLAYYYNIFIVRALHLLFINQVILSSSPSIQSAALLLARRYFRKYRLQTVNDYMISNPKPQPNPNPINSLPLLLTLSLLSQTTCLSLLHITKSTNCTSDIQNNSKQVRTFNNCTRQTCLRNLMNGHCTNIQKFQFAQEKCYQECCGSNYYDFMECQLFNQQRKVKVQSMESRLAVILIGTFVGIFVAVLIFVVYYVQCCRKQESKVRKGEEERTQNYKWKDIAFTVQKRCQKCKQKGAFVVHTCGIFYHLKCMNNNELWNCHNCQKPMKKLKFFCPVCLKKSVVVRAANFDELDKKIIQAYQFHPTACIQQMEQQMDTERKFTQTTKQ